MTNSKKALKVGHHTSITIGGKTYKNSDISRLISKTKEVHTVKGTENMPRHVTKVLNNEAGTVKTSIAAVSETKVENQKQLNIVASKAPVEGSSIGNAYFNTLAAGKHNSLKSNIDTSKVQTSKKIESTQAIRAIQAIEKGSYIPSHLIRNSHVEVRKVLNSEVGTIKTGITSVNETKGENHKRLNVVASKAPIEGISIGTAYFNTLAAGKHNSLKSNIDTSKVQTSKKIECTQAIRAIQAIAQGSYRPSHLIKSSHIEVRKGLNNEVETIKTSITPISETRPETRKQLNIVASKAPIEGISIGTAYFNTLSAGKYNSLKSKVDTSKIQTSKNLEKAAEIRAMQTMLKGNYTPSHIIKNTCLEAKASFYEAMERYKSGNITISQDIKNTFSTGGMLLVDHIQERFERHEDMGVQVASGVITTGILGYKGIQTAQAISPALVNTIKSAPSIINDGIGSITNVGKGIWDVTTTAGVMTVAVAKTAQMMRSGFIPFDTEFTKEVLLHQIKITGLLHSTTSQRIMNGVKQIPTSIKQMQTNLQVGIVTATNTAKSSYVLIRGMIDGTVMKSTVAHKVLMEIGTISKDIGFRRLKVAGQGMAHGIVKGGVWTLKRGLPKTLKSTSKLSMGMASVLTSTDDMMLQDIGNSMVLTNYGVKTSIVVGRVTGHAIKTSAKKTVGAVKGTYKAISFIRQKGLRAAWMKARKKTATTVMKAGKSVVSIVVNLVKAVGQKVVVPIILVVVIVSVMMSLLAAPTVTIGSIFSGLFDMDNGDGTYSETNIRAFITDPTNGIPAMRSHYISELYQYIQSNLESNGGTYDYVRFKTNMQEGVVDSSLAGISGAFYTEDELANIIQPIFNAVILKDYDLAPTKEEAIQVLSEIFEKLFRREEVATVEWCGQSLVDGSGTPVTHTCGAIHALGDCPNPIAGIHSSYTCPTCCYYYCPGHTETDSNGHTHTRYCSGCKHACSGYIYCGGHDILTVTLNMDGLHQLLYEYFEQPIDQLSNKTDRTIEEERRLSQLKDSYEICLEYIKQITEEYGGGLTMGDLSNVIWVNGSRVGNQALVDLALSQVGQIGGQPYWSWYGFSSRVEWCACFVSWCMARSGHNEVKYSSCQNGGVPYFKQAGRWAEGGYTDLVAGDVIFFDWNGNGRAQHTGIVIGTDGEYVYTVEGNSGDACCTRKYRIDDSCILGYGLMNY